MEEDHLESGFFFVYCFDLDLVVLLPLGFDASFYFLPLVPPIPDKSKSFGSFTSPSLTL